MRLFVMFALAVFGMGALADSASAFGKRGHKKAAYSAPVGSAASCCGGTQLSGQPAYSSPSVNVVMPTYGQMQYAPPVWSPSPGYSGATPVR